MTNSISECDHGPSAWKRRTTIALVVIMLELLVGLVAVTGLKAAEAAKISGKVLDATSGEPLVGFSVYLDGTKTGAMTDLDGNYLIRNIEPGAYTLVVSGLGYQRTEVPNLALAAGQSRELNFSLESKTVVSDSVVVTARALRNTEATMLKHRQKADFVGDAISAQEISKSGAGDAASAMEKVVGASVVGGKYVYVRGLGDRYANTQLNGSPLPSPDPDKQAVQMDLIPSGLLDNIVVQKTFTPDKPGNFTGGSVNMTTKDLPEGRKMSFSSSTSYNTNSTFNDNMPSYTGGSKDWLGYDDGARDVPDVLRDTAAINFPPFFVMQRNLRSSDPEKVEEAKRQLALYNEAAEALNPQMHPKMRDVPLNQSHSISYGDRLNLFNRPLGVQGSLSYSRNFTMYENGQANRYKRANPDSDTLGGEMVLTDSRGVDEVHWGSLLSFAYQFHPRHKVRFDYMHNQSGESSARYMMGEYEYQEIFFKDDRALETRVLEYVERQLSTNQISGSHEIKLLKPIRAEWQYSSSVTEQNEPDVRMFTDDFLWETDSITGATDTTYRITASYYRYPTHIYRELEETSRDGHIDLLFRFKENQPAAGSIKAGMAVSDKERTFREVGFELQPAALLSYDGDPDQFFSPENTGLIESQTNLDSAVAVRGNTIAKATEDKNNYDAEQEVRAWYGMVDFPLFNRIQVVTGARYEQTVMKLDQPFNTDEGALHNETLIDEGEWLPALNLRYGLSQNMNLRGAVSRTIARPTMRELAPYTNEEYRGGYLFTGNPELEYTTATNWDLRWEYFTGPGEVASASLFYKKMKNPIEWAIRTHNGEMRPQNVDKATVIGVEFEWRQGLRRLHPSLANFFMGGNLTFVGSKVDIPEIEMASLQAYDPDAEDTRPLQGQSPYIVNLDLSYNLPPRGFETSIMYNVFGERYMINGKEGTPDVYEQPRHMLDWNMSKEIFGGARLKLGASNLLNQKVELTQEYRGKEYYYRLYEKGVTWKIGLSVSM